MSARNKRRRWIMGLSTILGLKQKGFFLPYRYACSVQPIAYPALEPYFSAAKPDFTHLIRKIEALSSDIMALSGKAAGARFDQAWFPGLDALAAYAIIRDRQPRRIVEIGSGHSTRFMAAAIQDGGLSTGLVCIDPAPRASLDHLDVQWRPSILQEAPADDIEALDEGDLLFVDSSHLLMPGTDVDYLIGHILPRLRSGVYLHVHDIFLPDPYPSDWAWRGYNEQSAMAALLQGNGYDLVFASHYAATRMASQLKNTPFREADVASTALQSSLWLQKR
ncbi:MAG: class I SAM-dependent methyltransferase [Geminicoccaceae bacterium]